MKAGFVVVAVVFALLGFALAGAVARGASSHESGCHTEQTCPSDHHTYVWTDPATGLLWDCAAQGAPEDDPVLDYATFAYEGLTYNCRAAGPATTSTATTATESTSTSTTTTVPTTVTTTSPTTTFTTPGPGLPSIIIPDPKMTPGALNRKVRQATIRKTICKSGWTKKIRPSVSYTNALKIKQMVLYEETGSPSEYEEDHLIPLELGGAPRNPKNLWPEPRVQSRLSDPFETKLKRQVCKGVMKLKKARAAIRLFKNTYG
jgi:hypothetical protein